MHGRPSSYGLPAALRLLHLLPRECYSSELEDMPDDLVIAAEFYKKDVPHSVMLPTEYRMWVSKSQQHTASPEKTFLRSWWMHSLPVTGLLSPTFVCCYIWH